MPVRASTVWIVSWTPPAAIAALILLKPWPGIGTHESRGMSITDARWRRKLTPTIWIASDLARSTASPGLASLPSPGMNIGSVPAGYEASARGATVTASERADPSVRPRIHHTRSTSGRVVGEVGVVGIPAADQRRMREDLDPPRRRRRCVDLVVLQTHQVRQVIASIRSRPREQPGGWPHDDHVGLDRVALVQPTVERT